MTVGAILSQVFCDGGIQEMRVLFNNGASIIGNFEELPLEVVEKCIPKLEENLTIGEDG